MNSKLKNLQSAQIHPRRRKALVTHVPPSAPRLHLSDSYGVFLKSPMYPGRITPTSKRIGYLKIAACDIAKTWNIINKNLKVYMVNHPLKNMTTHRKYHLWGDINSIKNKQKFNIKLSQI